MLRKARAPFFVLVVFLLVVVSAGFALIKGLETSKQSIVKIGESITIPEGAEMKSAVAVGGSITVYGNISDDVVAVGGTVYLKDSAVVGGNVVAIGGKVMREPGAIVKGDIVEVSVGGIAPVISFFAKGGIFRGLALFWVLNMIGFLVLTIILVALFTPQLGKVSACLENDLSGSFLIGLVIALIFLPVVFLLIFSILGILLIPLWVVIVGAGLVFGYVAAGHFLGKKVLNSFKVYGKPMMVETVLGMILLCLIGLVPVGGTLVKIIVSLSGLGAVYKTHFGTR